MNQPVPSAARRHSRLRAVLLLAGVVMLTVAGSVMVAGGATAAPTPEPAGPVVIVCPPPLDPERPFPVCPLPDPCPLIVTPEGDIIHQCPPPCPPFVAMPSDPLIYCPPPER